MREDFAAFQRAAAVFGPKIGKPAFFKAVDHSSAQGSFRADDRQVRFFLESPRHQPFEIGGAEGKIGPELRRAGIARRGEKLEFGIVLLETPGHGVFASTGTEEKNFHWGGGAGAPSIGDFRM